LNFGVPIVKFNFSFADNGADATPNYGASNGAKEPVFMTLLVSQRLLMVVLSQRT